MCAWRITRWDRLRKDFFGESLAKVVALIFDCWIQFRKPTLSMSTHTENCIHSKCWLFIICKSLHCFRNLAHWMLLSIFFNLTKLKSNIWYTYIDFRLKWFKKLKLKKNICAIQNTRNKKYWFVFHYQIKYSYLMGIISLYYCMD
jgi:hypothetical protein